MYINRFLFEVVYQEYNPSFVKICNLLYLLTINQPIPCFNHNSRIVDKIGSRSNIYRYFEEFEER